MNATIKNIRSAYNDTRRFANKSSNSGVVEFTHAVRRVVHDHRLDSTSPIIPNGKLEIYKVIQQHMKFLGWNNYQFEKFDSLVSEAIKCPNLQNCVRGLFLFANNNATLEDQEDFLLWLEDEQLRDKGLMDINTNSTAPGDHFECCMEMSWDELEEYYNDRY